MPLNFKFCSDYGGFAIHDPSSDIYDQFETRLWELIVLNQHGLMISTPDKYSDVSLDVEILDTVPAVRDFDEWLVVFEVFIELATDQLVATTILDEDEPWGRIPLAPGGYGLRVHWKSIERHCEDEEILLDLEAYQVSIWESATFEPKILHGHDFIEGIIKAKADRLQRLQARVVNRTNRRNRLLLILSFLILTVFLVFKIHI